MTTVFDVAKYVLEKQGQMTAMKLQKLVYYSQAWHTVWEDEPLFQEPIKAWVNGPVVQELYQLHKGKFYVDIPDITTGNSSVLSTIEKENIDKVLGFYGDKSSQWLSELTHAETPWQEARKGLNSTQRGNNEISLASMVEYYGSL